MGTFVFQWAHEANEVFVTGTFDNWSKSEQLEKKGDIFEKEVTLPKADEKILYKFVVDGNWTTDHTAPQETDEHSNVNNILKPENIKPPVAMVSSVTPESTTAALAGAVPKEETKPAPTEATISSAAPDSTTAELAKDVPLEKKDTTGSSGLPGAFPETPAAEPTEPESFSVNPIPATSGIGNPIHLAPGEKVPDPSTLTSNTIASTVTTDEASYEKGADTLPAALAKKGDDTGAFTVPEKSSNLIPESSLPISEPGSTGPDTTDTGPTIQSAAPESSTAVLAGQVPLEPRGVATTVDPTPTEAATTNGEGPKEETVEGASKGEEPPVAADVPEPVKESIEEANASPEAAANETAVEEKKEVEEELKKEVKLDESAGEPAPTEAASTTLKAPEPTRREHSREISPHSRPTGQPAPETPNSKTTSAATTPAKSNTEGTPKKNKRRSFFGKLKDKLKG